MAGSAELPQLLWSLVVGQPCQRCGQRFGFAVRSPNISILGCVFYGQRYNYTCFWGEELGPAMNFPKLRRNSVTNSKIS